MEQPKKRKYLIATHGTFSTGVKSSLNMIIGDTENLYIIEAYVDDKVNIEDQIKLVLDEISNEDELIIFSDIMGGSVTNQLLQQVLKSNAHIVSGFNLPLLIEIMLADAETPIAEVIDDAIINAKEQMVYVNKLINSNNGEDQDD
ncbi:PTS system, fructoselysine and glucoselysine-specific IIA component [Mucilaginibacter mallensis]|uniref:PTS system, fructoselysine and glucoselysine-specific IIA component n=1 Tax=Mucilaginibacter mallensis TaxID=652787 RepID=A0A1H1WUP6_MUCMA|nr:PTS sugar transporter subunit IIA [Mucilaginibacter mallensis]SDT00762.1 PTS system, fructoselysine and glucoselysine-specific IIA component [Mucilaginibacter mallensis]